MATSTDALAAPSRVVTPEIQQQYARFAWGTLVYNIAVILWGAVVRATGSGAGCGDHWPLCNGQVLPRSAQVETLIELAHRATSGIALILVVGLIFGAFRWFPKGSPVRRGAVLSGVFVMMEALIGAGLVLLRLVAHDASLMRAVYLSVHLINTLILIAALALTAWWASGRPDLQLRDQGKWAWWLGLGAAGVLLLGVSGAIAALGDTLFPVSSFREGVQQELSESAHLFVRLRVFHPGLAIVIGGFLAMLGINGPKERRQSGAKAWGGAVAGIVLLQFVCGAVNAALAAPVWLQIVHLALANLLWVSYVFFSAGMLAKAD